VYSFLQNREKSARLVARARRRGKYGTTLRQTNIEFNGFVQLRNYIGSVLDAACRDAT
jgi:hypothetical protein